MMKEEWKDMGSKVMKKGRTRYGLGILLSFMVLVLVGCGEKVVPGADQEENKIPSENQDTAEDEEQQDEIELLSGKHTVEVVVKEYGTIVMELDADNAPISTSNFISLAKDGFYDGLTFHRIIYGFMIQGGDPSGNGTGGSDQTIKGEFKSNGVENPLTHTRGAVSMARSQMVDSASSQFFIVHEDSAHLDGDYAVFGYVKEGMDIVDQICEDTPTIDNNGSVEKAKQPIIESIKVIE